MQAVTVTKFRENLAKYLGMLAIGEEICVNGIVLKATLVVTTNANIGMPAIDARQTDLVEEVEKAVNCHLCKKNPAQRIITEDGEDYQICEMCGKKAFGLKRTKRLPLIK